MRPALILGPTILGLALTGCDAGHFKHSTADSNGSAVPASHPVAPTGAAVPLSTNSQVRSAAVAQRPVVGEIFGTVVGVSDGDTLTLLDAAESQHRIRLEGIDAPESHQAFGTRSKQELSRRVYLKSVRAESTGKDKYGRTLAHIHVGDLWVNRDLVENGFAWHYAQYSSSEELRVAEQHARAGRLGLWALKDPVAPWDFRHNPGLAAGAMETPAVAPGSADQTPRGLLSPQPASGGDATVYVTRTGSKYHSANCRFLSKSQIPMPLSEARARYTPCSVCGS